MTMSTRINPPGSPSRAARPWRWRTLAVTALGSLVATGLGLAQPAPPKNLVASDRPWDNGEQIDLRWEPSADDATLVDTYKVMRSRTTSEVEQQRAQARKKSIQAAKAKATEDVLSAAGHEPGTPLSPELLARVREARKAAAAAAETAPDPSEEPFTFLSFVPRGTSSFTAEKLDTGEGYLFAVIAVGKDKSDSAPAATTTPVSPVRQPFDGGRFPLAIITAIICGSVVAFIRLARTGRKLNIRKIAGLEAVTEAVGRATEMGRSIVFVPGIQDMNDIQTIAGLTVLSHVARTAAEYSAKVEVPTSRSLVMTAARETVQASYLAAGRPDAYNEDNIYYVTDEQFGYVAYLSGAMVREKPAACFYMGAFFAESLILAETGNAIGAIQVAGTAQPAQLPFFVAACDYTLIGEEFFAASAYLSGEPDQLGSLKGQDVGKGLVAAIMIVGIVLATVASYTHSEAIGAMVDYLRSTMLT